LALQVNFAIDQTDAHNASFYFVFVGLFVFCAGGCRDGEGDEQKRKEKADVTSGDFHGCCSFLLGRFWERMGLSLLTRCGAKSMPANRCYIRG
jgi:hypothetical protein